MKKKRIATMAIILLVCLGILSGCGSSNATPVAQEPAETESTPTAEKTEKGAYQAQYLPAQDENLTAALQNGTLAGEQLYFTSLGVIADNTPEGVTPDWPEQYWTYGPILCRLGLDGSVERLPYQPQAEEATRGSSGVIFEKLCASSDGGLWILEKHYHIWNEMAEETAENGTVFRTEENYRMVRLGADGTPTASFPLDKIGSRAEEMRDSTGNYSFSIGAMAEDGKGRLWVSVSEWYVGSGAYAEDNRLCILDGSSGELQNTVKMASAPEHMVSLADGRIAVAFYERGTQVIGISDPESGNITDTFPVSDYLTALVRGAEHAVCYAAGDSFYGLDPESGESVKLLRWTDCDVARSGNESICVLPDGRIVTCSSEETAKGVENNLILLSRAEGAATSEKKTLRLAVMNLNTYTSKMVIRFNRTNPDYRIEVTDYSQYNDFTSENEADWNAGITRLQTEIIAGDVPDLLDLSLLPAERIGAKGILEDLYPLIDQDPELNRSDLLEGVLAAFEENGKLYQTVSNFYILTTAGLSDRVGEEMGWTMEDFRTAMKALQEENPAATVFDRYLTRDNVMTFLLYLELENFVDWETATCHFDSESFKSFLEFAKGFPESFDWNGDTLTAEDYDPDMRLLHGLQLMKQCNFARFEDVQVNTTGLGGKACTFIGYPTESGVGSMFAQVGNSLAITTSCADRDAAWQFVRMFFLPEYQEQLKGYVFPTNRAVYEEMKRDAVSIQYQRNPDGSFAVDEDGKRIEADRGSTQLNGQTLAYKTVTESEIAILEQVIAATTHVLQTDESLKEIIVSGAEAYFADQRSVEEVAALIQSRASLYVSEQQ